MAAPAHSRPSRLARMAATDRTRLLPPTHPRCFAPAPPLSPRRHECTASPRHRALCVASSRSTSIGARHRPRTCSPLMADRPALQHHPHACFAAASSLPRLRSHAKASRHQCAIAAASCLTSHPVRTTPLALPLHTPAARAEPRQHRRARANASLSAEQSPTAEHPLPHYPDLDQPPRHAHPFALHLPEPPISHPGRLPRRNRAAMATAQAPPRSSPFRPSSTRASPLASFSMAW